MIVGWRVSYILSLDTIYIHQINDMQSVCAACYPAGRSQGAFQTAALFL